MLSAIVIDPESENMSLRTDYLVTFVTVVELGNFTKAAKSLEITEGSVTHQIKALELFFKAELFAKTRSGPKLTEEGKIVYDTAKDVLNKLGSARRQIMDMDKVLRGTITIGASTIPGEHIVPRLIKAFKEKHQGVDFAIQISDTKEAFDRLRLGEVDLAAVGSLFLAPKDLEYEVKTIGEEELVLITSPNHKLAAEETVSAKELLSLPFISRERGSGTRVETERFLRESGVDPAKLGIKLELGSTEAIITAVSEDTGVSIISETAARKVERAGLIKILKIRGVNSRRKLYLIRNVRGELSKQARLFWEHLP